MLYFSYGSNMLEKRLRLRVPSARFIGRARLPGHRLAWHKVSKDGSGKCDIVKEPGEESSVWGVLFTIDDGEKRLLDKAEGLGYGYDMGTVTVITSNGHVEPKTYKASNIDPTLEPFVWYHALVVAGAKEHKLPDAYIKQLEDVPTRADPDRERHRRAIAILGNPRV